MIRQTRRSLAVSAVAAGIALPFTIEAAPVDAGLLAACSAFRVMHAELVALNARNGVPDDEMAATDDRWSDALEAVIEADAQSWQGVVAKAEVLSAALLQLVADRMRPTIEEAGEEEDRLAWSLCQNIAAISRRMEGAKQ